MSKRQFFNRSLDHSYLSEKKYGAGEKYEKRYKKTGKNTVGDLDDDDTIEDDAYEYAGRKDIAIKAKVAKEDYSNWRHDLSEVVDKLEKEKNDGKVEEKKNLDNKKYIKINPNLGEAVEDLGGTLLEMVEIGEVDYIVESVYSELLDEGYEEHDIEEALEYALIEAKVTFGHDTEEPYKKKTGAGRMIKAVGRLARQKLSSKVRGAKSAVDSAIVSGARKVAKGALGVARKIEGDKKPSPAHVRARTASRYSGGGVGQRERVSSGSYTPPQRPKDQTQKSPDPWEGSYSTSSKSSSTSSSRSQSGSANQSKSRPTGNSSTNSINQKISDRIARVKRRNPNLTPEDERRIKDSIGKQPQSLRARMAAAAARHGIDESHFNLSTRRVEPGDPGESHKKAVERLAAIAATKKKPRKPVGTYRRGSGSFKPSSPEEAKANIDSWDNYWSSAAKGYKEEYEIAERKMTSADKAKESKLKAKYDDSEMKQNMIDQYGEEEGTKIYFATIRKKAMKEEFVDEAKLSRTEKRARSAGKKKGNSKTMSLVDLDDNAMKEKKPGVGAKIEVKSGGETKKSLSPQEFNSYKFKNDEKPDFQQFRSSKVFKKTLKGNKHVRNLHRGSDASGLTARGGMDNNREVVKHVRDSGFNKKHGVNFKGVHFTGDVPGKGTDDKKMKVIKNLIKTRKPKTIKFSDDHAKNLSAPEKFNKEEGKDKNKNRGSSVPKIKTYLTRGDGKPVRFGSGGRGVRDTGNVNPASSTKENQRRRQKARRGMGEAVDMMSSKDNQNKKPNSSQINQLLTAKQKVNAAQENLANKQKMATQKGINLQSLSS